MKKPEWLEPQVADNPVMITRLHLFRGFVAAKNKKKQNFFVEEFYF